MEALQPPFDRLVERYGWSVFENSNSPQGIRLVLHKEDVKLEYDASRDGIFEDVVVDIYKFPIRRIVEFLGLHAPTGMSIFEVINDNFDLVRRKLSKPATRGGFRRWTDEREGRIPRTLENSPSPSRKFLNHLKQFAAMLLLRRQI